MYEVCSKQKGEQMALKYGSRDSLNAQISHQKYSVIEEWMQYHLDNNLDCVESGNRNEKIFKLLPDMALVDGFRYCANCNVLYHQSKPTESKHCSIGQKIDYKLIKSLEELKEAEENQLNIYFDSVKHDYDHGKL